MQNKSGVNPRNLNPMSVPGLSDEARQAVNAAFDAMSTWCIEIANNNEKNSEQVIDKLAAAARARANRGCHPRAASEHHENADPSDGSHDGCLGGANQITEPDDRPVDDALEAQILARRAGRHSA
jgi:hypothetical protein